MPIKIDTKEDLLSVIQSQANKIEELEKHLTANDDDKQDDNGDDDKDKTDTSGLDFLFE